MRLLLSYLFCIFSIISIAQDENIAINNNGNPPDPSAILDIQSINKGVAFPRMTTAERNAIQDPTIGLIIYNIDTHCFEYYLGVFWFEIYGNFALNSPYLTINKGLQEMRAQDKDTMRITTGLFMENEILLHKDTVLVCIGGFDRDRWVKSTDNEETEITMNSGNLFFIDSSHNIKLGEVNITGPASTSQILTFYGLKLNQSTFNEISSCGIVALNWRNGLPGFYGSQGNTGGIGGHVGVGGGGPTFAIYKAGTSIINLTNNTLSFGVPGIGGFSDAGGNSNGATGDSGENNF